MERRVQEIRRQFDRELAAAADPQSLEALRVRYVGRRAGLVTTLLKDLRDVAPADRAAIGKAVNDLKGHVEAALEAAAVRGGGPRQAPLPGLDLTLPGRAQRAGCPHPITQVRGLIEEIFLHMGYTIETGPEVESDYYNFEALNIPAHHPARDMQDTFYVEGGWLLRTHTSPVQIRTMERRRPPIKMVALGKVFRRDSDLTHSPVFHQVEGLVVGEGVTFAHLKGTLEHFCRRVFERDLTLRLRPSYFPFVEPGAEYDISCIFCDGASGCRRCKGTGFIEMGGAGMVHPAVFEKVGYDAERFTGFAFGLGIERIAMLKHGIDDIRLFYENDLRFLGQFPA